MSNEKEIHVSTRVMPNPEEQKFKLPETAPLLEVLQVGAQLASVRLLPTSDEPLDRLHAILSHNNVGPAIDDPFRNPWGISSKTPTKEITLE